MAFVFQGMVAALAAFVKPAIDASIPNLARNEDELRKANALMGSTWGVMLAVGAGLGGLFSQAFGRRRRSSPTSPRSSSPGSCSR